MCKDDDDDDDDDDENQHKMPLSSGPCHDGQTFIQHEAAPPSV
jgi:hypothetical protein